jgi:catechol 2,3-dioxygenase
MDHQNTTSSRAAIDPGAAIGWAALTVADLQRSLDFYIDVLGFKQLDRQERSALLGTDSQPLLLLQEQPGALPRQPRTTGLYHIAILLPDRIDLGHVLQRIATRYKLDGYADHLVSEALYLSDPDGNGLEIYRDRARGEWQWRGGQVRMASDPIDLSGMVREAELSGRVWEGLPEGTTIGHMHLQIGDLAQAEAFYHGVLGFDVVARMPGALFVSAGGYHHHLGLNTWQSRNAPPAPDNSAGLHIFAISVPDEQAQRAVAERLEAAGVAVTEQTSGLVFHDPWRNAIMLIPVARHNDAVAQVAAGQLAGVTI